MPVWDDFLSENDKKMLANRKPMRPKPHAEFGERPAILVIDMNKGAIGPDEPVYEVVKEMPGAMGSNAWAAIRHMEDLLPKARAAGIPVVYSRHYFRVSTGLGLSDAASPYSELNPMSEIQDEIAMQPGDLLVDKQQASVFHQTGLINMLLNKGVDNLIVTGNSTSGCVHATVVDAGGYQLKVSIVEDAVFDRFDLSHAAALFNMGTKYGDIVSIGEVYEYIAAIEDGERVPA